MLGCQEKYWCFVCFNTLYTFGQVKACGIRYFAQASLCNLKSFLKGGVEEDFLW